MGQPRRIARSLRRTSSTFAALLVALCAGFVLIPAAVEATCDPGVVALRGDWGRASFQVEIADTERMRRRGLMHRDQLPRGRGMLFVFEEAGPVSFWMKNTLISLDMLFMDESGQVVSIHERAEPQSLQSIHGGNAIRYVLEINGGVSDRFGITIGTQARHPAFDQQFAIWPCGAS